MVDDNAVSRRGNITRRRGWGERTLEAEALSEAMGEISDEVHVSPNVFPLALDFGQVFVEVLHQPAFQSDVSQVHMRIRHLARGVRGSEGA
jgi:hypothetical protein